jgi:hypothetical protein
MEAGMPPMVTAAAMAVIAGNALCLCAKHFAQWRLAAKIATHEITDQIGRLKLDSEGGDGDLSIHFQLVDQKVIIKLCERHALALRKLAEVADILSTNSVEIPKVTNPNPDQNLSESISTPHMQQVISPLASSSALKSCPYCQAKVNSRNLEAHMQKRCPKRHNKIVNQIISYSNSRSSNSPRVSLGKSTPTSHSNTVNSGRTRCKFCSNYPIPGSDVCYSCGG